MKKLVAVFLIAVLGPSLVLAWLAMRSLRDQEIVVHSQRALLHQAATDALASDLSTFMDDVRVFFGRLVDELVVEYGADDLTQNFDDIVPARWGQASFSCVITDEGKIICPSVDSPDPDVQLFLSNNLDFLTNRKRSEYYQARETIGDMIVVQETENAAETGEEPEEKSAPPNGDGGGQEIASKKPSAPKAAPTSAPGPAPAPAPAPTPSAASAGNSSEDQFSAENLKGMTQQKVGIAEGKLRSVYSNRRAVAQNLDQSQAPQEFIGDPQVRFQSEEQAGAVQPPGRGATSPSQQQQERAPQGSQRLAFQFDGADAATNDSVPQESVAENAVPQPDAELALQQARQQPQPAASQKFRNVQPFAQLGHSRKFEQLANAANDVLSDNPNAGAWSSLEVNWGDLRESMGDAPEGAISRFLEDGLHILLWRRHPNAPGTVFWTELNLGEIQSDLTGIVREASLANRNPEVNLALLDANSQVVARTVEGVDADWGRPFVASEIGEILPHWEVAAYLLDPDGITRSADLARMVLRIMVPALLIAIGLGALLIFTEMGREMRLARQKTDFVSNVSHELKTPLTSIRMFSDLLSTPKEVEGGKRTEYSGIISREAARLTRLINNLLDFSRMERGEKKYEFEKLNAVSLARETVENYRHQIEADGFNLNFRNLDGDSIPISGDRDSLSQVLLNLLSNAEKYGGDADEIDLEVGLENRAEGDVVEIRVLDRGPGVSRKHCAKIFEKFFRADDSLSSGIEGSGLGLTLARQIARAHGGDVILRPREGGGSCFALALPVLSPETQPHTGRHEQS